MALLCGLVAMCPFAHFYLLFNTIIKIKYNIIAGIKVDNRAGFCQAEANS